MQTDTGNGVERGRKKKKTKRGGRDTGDSAEKGEYNSQDVIKLKHLSLKGKLLLPPTLGSGPFVCPLHVEAGTSS